MQKVIIALAMAWALVGMGCGVDIRDPKSVATAVLEAAKAQDFDALADLAWPRSDKEMPQFIKDRLERSLIDDAEIQRHVQAWDGTFQAEKSKEFNHYFKFAEADGKIVAVHVTSDLPKWYLKGVKSLTPEEWEAIKD